MNAPIMRQKNQFAFLLLAALTVQCIPSMLVAQQERRPTSPAANNVPAGKAAVGNRPAAKPATDEPPVRETVEKKKPRPAPVVDAISPELEKILVQWETESAKIKSLHGKHTRSEFNKTFEVEKVSKGEFFLETPDKGRIDMVAKEPKKGEVSSRKNAEGQPYALEKGMSERWICTGEEIYSFNDDDKTYNREELPANMRGKNIVHSPLPFLFGMKAADAKNRFNMALISVGKDSVKLKAIPRMDSDRQNYHEAWIILDTKRYIPTAVRLIDPNGLETVYMFEEVTINDGNFAKRIVASFRGNPYKPVLKDYKRHIPNEVEPASGNSNGASNQTQQAGGPSTIGRKAEPSNSKTPPSRTSSVPQPNRNKQ